MDDDSSAIGELSNLSNSQAIEDVPERTSLCQPPSGNPSSLNRLTDTENVEKSVQ